jgi:hypothetical protein
MAGVAGGDASSARTLMIVADTITKKPMAPALGALMNLICLSQRAGVLGHTGISVFDPRGRFPSF